MEYRVLKNGLRVVAEEIPYVRSVSLGLWIDVGSIMEDNTNYGIAHFIEHMLFKGTTNRTSRQISNDIDYYGGNINAFTTEDHTCFHVKIPSNHIDRGIEVLSDMLVNSKFDKKDIEKEKSVIIEEIKMYKDSSEDYLYEELLLRTFDNKGIGRNVLGTKESVQGITREKILNFFNKYYIPNNSVVVISGNFSIDEVLFKLEECFKTWERRELTPVIEQQKFKPVKFVKNKDDEQANLAIIFQCPDDSIDKEFFAVKLLGNIVGNTPSSRLFQHVREERGLSYSIYTSESFYRGFGEFGIFSSMAVENLKEVYNLVIREIEDIKNNYITEEELKFAKEQYKGMVIMNLEDTEDRMMQIGEYEVENRRLLDIERTIECVNSIDIEYMKGIIDRTFSEKMSVGITGNSVEKIMEGII